MLTLRCQSQGVTSQIGYLATIILPDLQRLTEPGATGAAPGTFSRLMGDQGPLAICTRSLTELQSKLPSGPVNLRQKPQWPFESKKINEIMDRIEAQVTVLELALVGDIYGMAAATQGFLEDSRRRQEKEKVLDWLACADASVKHLESRALHQPGANGWLLESEQFQEWKSNPGQVLWLHGIPGAGKTGMFSVSPSNISNLIIELVISSLLDNHRSYGAPLHDNARVPIRLSLLQLW